MQNYSWTRLSTVNHRRSFPIFFWGEGRLYTGYAECGFLQEDMFRVRTVSKFTFRWVWPTSSDRCYKKYFWQNNGIKRPMFQFCLWWWRKGEEIKIWREKRIVHALKSFSANTHLTARYRAFKNLHLWEDDCRIINSWFGKKLCNTAEHFCSPKGSKKIKKLLVKIPSRIYTTFR